MVMVISSAAADSSAVYIHPPCASMHFIDEHYSHNHTYDSVLF